jgi:hypothetical protein
MTFRPCPHQTEIKELLGRGHWPHACPPELRAHLAECRSCADLVQVTQAFRQDRATATAQAQLPAPGAIWWRAQLRRRNAALQRVGRPILGAYIFAMSMTLLVAVGLVVSQARHGLHWMEWLEQPGTMGLHLESFSPFAWLSSGGSLAVLIPVLATVALLGAVVVYLTVERQ